MRSGSVVDLKMYHLLMPHADSVRTALIGPTTSITYKQLADGIEQACDQLRSAGVKSGDLVALKLKSSFTFVRLLYAIWKLEAQAMLIDSRLKADETDELLQSSRPAYVITSCNRLNPLTNFEEELEVEITRLEHPRPYDGKLMLHLFTSGSTGKPKSIGRKWSDIAGDMYKLTEQPFLKSDDRVLALSPLGHTYGLLNGLLQTLLIGAVLVFPSDNQSRSVLETLRKERITVMYGVPFHYRMLSGSDDRAPLPDLRAAISAGEPLDFDVHRAFLDKFGVRIGQQYGTSETGVLTMDWRGEQPQSAGRPLPGVQLEARDGEIRVRLTESPYLTDGASDRWQDGWFHTADAGRIDEHGFLHLEGRIDDIHIVGGLKVNVLEVENRLKQHPLVLDVRVGVSDAGMLEAEVKRHPDLTETELQAWCREHLADYKWPRKYRWTDHIQRTSTGKIVRHRPGHAQHGQGQSVRTASSPDEAEPARKQRDESDLRSHLLRHPDDVDALRELAALYERQHRWLQANDTWLAVRRLVRTDAESAAADQALSQVGERLKAASYTPADEAAVLDKVVSIYCYGRSGTHFFKSLLDSHPQVILSMLSGPDIFKLWHSMIENAASTDREAWVEAIFETFPGEFNEGKVYEEPRQNGMCHLGPDRDRMFTIDRTVFRERFLAIVDEGELPDARQFYQAVQLAASCGIGHVPDLTRGIPVIVEGGIHFATETEATAELIHHFPYTRLLHMIRNPVTAFASALNYQLKVGIADMYHLGYQLHALFHGIPIDDRWSDRTLLVKLEDLHTKSRETLELVCRQLGIEWSDTLLSSTFGGLQWWNTLSSKTVTGFNRTTIANKYDDLLSDYDRSRLEAMLSSRYEAWGYPLQQEIGDDLLQTDGLDEPFRFEKWYAADDGERKVLRMMLKRICTKLLREDRERGEDDRPERRVKLLSPGGSA